jgi:hypothetical protein
MPFPVIPAIAAGIGLGGSLYSMFNGPEIDVQKQRQQLADFIRQQYGPDVLNQNWNLIYGAMEKSPYFQNTLRGINASAAGFGANAARNLGRTGASTSGVGALAGAAAQSAGGFGRAQARGGLSSAALQAAQGNLANQLETFSFGNQRLNPYYNPALQMFGGLLGGGAMGLSMPWGGGGGGGGGGGQVPMGGVTYDQVAAMGRLI